MSHRKVLCVHDAELARYASYFEIGHNACEFLIDFGQFRPEGPDVAWHTRIVMGPIHAKLLARMLQEAVTRHEADYGSIPDFEDTAASEAPAPDSEHSTAYEGPDAKR